MSNLFIVNSRKKRKGHTMPKTAEQMNAERRAAKARQQAAAKARGVNREKDQEFSLQEAQKENRKRENAAARRTAVKTAFVEEKFAELIKRGSIKIAKQPTENRDFWISFCFELIKKVRESEHKDKITYTRDWKETGVLVMGFVR